jgi:hypothetical protein
MTKPVLPASIVAKLPKEVVALIYSFVPHNPPPPPPSPSLERALKKLQETTKRSAMDMYGLDDFVCR